MQQRHPQEWSGFLGATLLPLLLTALLPVAAHAAAPVSLSESDFSLGLAEYTEAGDWVELDTSSLDGVFGPHRCQCSENLAPLLQPTDTGQTDIGSSTIGVTFYLGDNCYAAPSSCTSLGQASFSASQQASAPKFSSNAVFEAATGSTSPSCTSLSAASTTLWAILTQDGTPLAFSLTIDLPISGATVGAPTGVTAEPANEGLLVSWSPPADASLVAGYQVLCLPRPTTASAAGYESCGLVSNPSATVITSDDETQLCSAALSATARSVRVTGLSGQSQHIDLANEVVRQGVHRVGVVPEQPEIRCGGGHLDQPPDHLPGIGGAGGVGEHRNAPHALDGRVGSNDATGGTAADDGNSHV